MIIKSIFLFLVVCSVSTFSQTPQTITFPDIPVKGYGDTSFSLNASAISGLAVTYVSSNTTVATVSGTTVTIKTTGNSFISAYQAGNGTYSAAIPVPQLLVVCPKATLTVTADNKSITSGTANPTLTYTTTGFKNSQTSAVITGTPAFQSLATNPAVGTYPIVINRGTMAAANYEFMMVDGTFTISSGTATPIVNAEDSVLKIYPNPASNSVSILNLSNESFVILDLTGKMVMSDRCTSDEFKIDTSGLAPGMYILRSTKNNLRISTKLLIKK